MRIKNSDLENRLIELNYELKRTGLLESDLNIHEGNGNYTLSKDKGGMYLLSNGHIYSKRDLYNAMGLFIKILEQKN